MLWEQVRKAYPDHWVVIEAVSAHSESNFRIVDDVAVIDSFDDSMDAFRHHDELHKQNPNRELYFFHTSRENLDIREKKWTGLRKSMIKIKELSELPFIEVELEVHKYEMV